jgi:phosphopantothenate-cysteine ligase
VGHLPELPPLSRFPKRSLVSRPGTRGATSAEYFLKAGYAVIFMHRQFSLQPFSRHYSHSTNPFLDFLEVETSPDDSPDPPKINVTPSKYDDLLDVLTAYKSVQQAGLLHTLTFVTVNDYLWLLRAVSQELSVLGRSVLYYLAAAVSDFFLPRQKMVRHHSLVVNRLLTLRVYSRNTRFNPGKEAC